jgi:hypothetical protein
MRQRIIFLAAVLLAAAVLAYSFAETVRDRLIAPLAYDFWQLGHYYRAIPQQIFWAGLIMVVLYLILLTVSDFTLRSGGGEKRAVRRGPVESLARNLEQRNQGIYFKWQIANQLAGLALDILKHQKRLFPGRKLRGRDWNPPPEVEKYLDAALNTTFADYPLPRRLGPRPITPFDADIEPVLDFLESELETDEHDPRHS